MFVKLQEGAKMPTKANPGDAGFDLYAYASTMLEPDSTTFVRTGVSMCIPVGMVGLVFQRSGYTKINVTLANAVGVIDSPYRGEIIVALRNRDPEQPRLVAQGERVAQIVIMPISMIELEEYKGSDVGWESSTARGIGGFGSTGK